MEARNSKNNKLLNLVALLPVIGVIIISVILTNIFISSMYNTHKDEVSRLEKEYLNDTKEKIKNRIKNISNTIDKDYEYEINQSKHIIKYLVSLGYSLIDTIYKNNKNKSKEEIFKIIHKELKNIRFFDNNNGYYFIYKIKSGDVISLPATPKVVGKSLLDSKNLSKKTRQAIITGKEGYYTWYWNKPYSDIRSKKIGYIKPYKPLGIVIGTAMYEDDIKNQVSKNLVKIIEKFKYQDKGYIFILNKDGVSILHKNKKLIGTPLEDLSLTVQKNVHTILKKAKLNNETFIEYQQDKNLFDDFLLVKKVSFVKYNKKFDWVIGTGLYLDYLNKRIKDKKELLEAKLNESIKLIIISSIFISLFIIIIVLYISKQIKNTLVYYSDEINNKNEELKSLNLDLEKKIENQVNTLRKKDLVLNQQSKLVAMGEMLGNIAHQWRQPLSAISTLASGISIRREMGTISEEQIDSDLENIVQSTRVLSDTIDDFRNFYSSKKEKVVFGAKTLVEQVLNLISANLKTNDINIHKNIQDIECNSYKNEIVQVLLNIINNAKDALIELEEYEKHIFIDIKQIDENLKIVIYDNAKGIEDDIKERIFEPYFTTKFKSKGTGIGLYMSKNIVETSLDGTIGVENHKYTYEGKEYTGAMFTIIIPKD